MKKLLLTLATLSLITTAHAVQDDLALQGTVQEEYTMSFAEIGTANLNLDLKATTDQHIANLLVYSNAASGFSISFDSLNGDDPLAEGSQGILRDIATGNFVRYSLTVGAIGFFPSGVIENTAFPVVFRSRALHNNTASPNLPSGTYTDTVTATMYVNI